jgi:flagellar basal-body rod modification protein FlgD
MSTSTVTNNSQSQAIWAALNGTKDTSSSSGKSSSDTSATGIQNQFLKLLTTQLQNQDPLNPMDNAQVTSQLAQISTVQGIQGLNTTLQTMLGNTQESQAMQAAALVGHAVLVPGSSIAAASGVTSYAGFDLKNDADKVTVTIKNSSGTVVRTLDLGSGDAGPNMFSWDGKSDNGTQAADGTYKFTVSATQAGASVGTTALSVGKVGSVVRSGTGFTLDVGALGTASFNDVREVF